MPSRSDAAPSVGRREGTAIAVACVAIAAFYALCYGVRHVQVPVADDSFFYVWAVRFAGTAGLADSHLAARPAFPLLGSALGGASGASPWLVAAGLPITMAAGLALAGGAVATRWGLRGWWLAPFVTLTALSAVTARLVAGKTENLLTLWFLAGVIAVAAWADGRRRIGGVVVLSFAAGLSEWPFLAAFLGLVAVTLAARWIAARWIDVPDDQGLLASMLGAGLAGFALALAVVSVWNGTQLGSVIQALPSDFAYRSRFRIEVALMWPTITFLLAAVGWWVAGRWPGEATRILHWLFGLWLAATGAILLVGWSGVHLPTYRALTFALPIALAVGAAPFAVRTLVRSASGRRRAVGWVVGTAVAVAAVVPAWAMWYRDFHGRASLAQIADVAAAARYALEQRSPVVLVVNEHIERVYFYGRVAADVLPPERREHLVVFAGTSADALAGRPTVGVDPDRDALARTVFDDIGPLLASGAPVLTARSLDPSGFEDARARGAPLIGGGSVAVLRGPRPAEAARSSVRIVPVPDWWQVLLLGLLWLALLGAAGAGWSVVVSPDAPLLVRGLLAPALGAASLATIALVLVHLHVRINGGGAAVGVVLALAASGVAAGAARRRETVPA